MNHAHNPDLRPDLRPDMPSDMPRDLPPVSGRSRLILLTRLDQPRVRRAALALVVGAFAMTGAYGYILHNKVTLLEATVVEKTALLETTKKKLDGATISAADLEKKVASNEAQCRSSHLQLKAAIDAFATQAAACEAVKRQFSVEGKS